MIILTRMLQISAIRLAIPGLGLLLLASACGSINEPEPENPFNVESEVVTAAGQIDSMQFAPDGRLFYADHWTGDIRVVDAAGNLLPDPFAHLDVLPDLQTGLTGIALDPEFADNHFVYVFSTKLVQAGPPRIGKPEIVRFTDENNRGVAPTVIDDKFPETNDRAFNVNGRIHFGPDGYLYVTVGDYDKASELGPNGQQLAQDPGSPVGKVLRLNKDGSPAPGNPFTSDPTADPRVFALGFRAAFDFTFQSPSGAMYGSDSTGVTCEEINLVESGKNYGWPDVGQFPFANCEEGNTAPAVLHLAQPEKQPADFLSQVDLTGMTFVSGAKYPTLGDSLIVCEAVTQMLRGITIPDAAGSQPNVSEPIVQDCRQGMTVSPDGILYYSNGTEIRRLIPGPAQAETPQQ